MQLLVYFVWLRIMGDHSSVSIINFTYLFHTNDLYEQGLQDILSCDTWNAPLFNSIETPNYIYNSFLKFVGNQFTGINYKHKHTLGEAGLKDYEFTIVMIFLSFYVFYNVVYDMFLTSFRSNPCPGRFHSSEATRSYFY